MNKLFTTLSALTVFAFVAFYALSWDYYRVSMDAIEMDIDCYEMSSYVDETPTDIAARLYVIRNCR